MVKRKFSGRDEEPENSSFGMPSQKEHLFQVSSVFTSKNNPFSKGLDENTVVVKCEVASGDEKGRTLLNRLTIDDQAKGFFATRLFLKAIGMPYKGDDIELDTDLWQGLMFYATVVYDGKYANIEKYNFEKRITQGPPIINKEDTRTVKSEIVAWDE